MLKLIWGNKSIDDVLFDLYVNRIQGCALHADTFSILLPITVYKRIKRMGINAKLEELTMHTVLLDTLWIKVSKSD